MFIDYFSKTTEFIVLRKFSEKGPYFLVRLCRQSKHINEVIEMQSLPDNWPAEYVESLLKKGNEIFKQNLACAY